MFVFHIAWTSWGYRNACNFTVFLECPVCIEWVNNEGEIIVEYEVVVEIASGEWRETVARSCLCFLDSYDFLEIRTQLFALSLSPRHCSGSANHQAECLLKRSPAKTASHSESKCRDVHINRLWRQRTRLASFVFRSFIKRYTLSVWLLSQTPILVFLPLYLSPLPASLKRSMSHNNEELFHISPAASQPLLFV